MQKWTNVQPHKMQQTVAVRKKYERNYMVKLDDWNEPANQMRWQFLEAIFRQFPDGKKKSEKKQPRTNKPV